MHAWKSIQRVIGHIEANLDEEMEINKLAEIAYLSSFYFQRLFSRLVKKPVTDTIYKACKYSKFWLEKHGLAFDKGAVSPEVYYPNLASSSYMELWLAVGKRA